MGFGTKSIFAEDQPEDDYFLLCFTGIIRNESMTESTGITGNGELNSPLMNADSASDSASAGKIMNITANKQSENNLVFNSCLILLIFIVIILITL